MDARLLSEFPRRSGGRGVGRLAAAMGLCLWVLSPGCGDDGSSAPEASESAEAATPEAAPAPVKEPPRPPAPELVDPVPLWEDGRVARQIDAAGPEAGDYLIIDLGEAWTPYLFTEGEDAEGKPRPNAYRQTYLQLARGEWPKNHHGERAKRDKYLELYGIMPTLKVLRERYAATEALACRESLDLEPLLNFSDVVAYKSNQYAKKRAGDYPYLSRRVAEFQRRQGVTDESELDLGKLKARERDIVRRYRRQGPEYRAVVAMQDRLKCEGFFKGRGRYVKGGLDWTTHDALAEFERRHRIYSWGYIGRDSLRALRMSPLEAERESVLRVLTERAVHAAGVIEDGSMSFIGGDETRPRTFKGMDGKDHPVPNLVAQIQDNLVSAFGLQTPDGAKAFLDSLGELPEDGHQYVAIAGVELPEYYDGMMELTLRYDRGDVWYDFPFDAEGNEIPQPVRRRPRTRIMTRYNDQWIPLARFGTTIGGWRSEWVDGTVMWKYKESPAGPRAWERIVAAPVWLPPDGTPPRDILKRKAKRKPGEPKLEVNYHETGPSYASAYGLVAAYHRKFLKRADGTIRIGGDEGIRTHGSVDYMSIMRRHSHGCHRLHNHIAVRLMSFVLAHRPHRRVGQQPLSFHKIWEHDGVEYPMDITRGGYIFEFETPLVVTVEEGRIRGRLKQALRFPIPKYDENLTAYIMPDGRSVKLEGGQLVDVPLPLGMDAGVPLPNALDSILTDALDTGEGVVPARPSPSASPSPAPSVPSAPPSAPPRAPSLPPVPPAP